jgi:hypothetical protein
MDRGAHAGDSHHRYHVYGVDIVSDRALTLPRYAHDTICSVEVVSSAVSDVLDDADQTVFDSPPDSWCRFAALVDGSTYVRWNGVGEFRVASDGRRIVCRPAEAASAESFQVYLLGQAVACALVKQAIEPLHATAVVVDDRAVAFLGGSAFGKSTLAASFLGAGCPLLTDDLLVARESSGGVVAYPGPPRLKLFPAIATRVLGRAAAGITMNADTAKLIVPIEPALSCDAPVPLHAVYALASPRDACRHETADISPIAPRDAFLELIAHAFDRRVTGATRRARQFAIMAQLADRIPIRRLAYPRALDRLDAVRDAILDDLDRCRSTAQRSSTVAPCHLE